MSERQKHSSNKDPNGSVLRRVLVTRLFCLRNRLNCGPWRASFTHGILIMILPKCLHARKSKVSCSWTVSYSNNVDILIRGGLITRQHFTEKRALSRYKLTVSLTQGFASMLISRRWANFFASSVDCKIHGLHESYKSSVVKIFKAHGVIHVYKLPFLKILKAH